MSSASARERVGRLLTPVVTAAGYELEDVTLSPVGRRTVLRVVVDRDGGVDLDDVALISRQASAALDGSDVMGERPYLLEVSSPGVDRPLAEPRHWRRARGRLVRVPLTAGGELTGRVQEADAEAVTLLLDDETRRIPYPQLGVGAVQVEFARRAEP